MKRFGVWAAAAMGLALAACGGGGDGAPAAGSKIGGDSGTELADVQVLRLGNGGEVETIDPQRIQSVQASHVARDLFEGLIAEAPNGDLEPGAAESWTVGEDGKTYRFALRRNAKWSNGEPVTAKDFVYGLRRGVDPATLSVYGFILSPIVNADDITAGR